jgi:hypothetical protein
MNLKKLIVALSEVMAEKASVDTKLKFVQKEKKELLEEWPAIVQDFHEQLEEIQDDEDKLIEAQTVIADKFGAIMLEANTSLPYRILRKVYGIVGGPLF